jgi:hypothetical protein
MPAETEGKGVKLHLNRQLSADLQSLSSEIEEAIFEANNRETHNEYR